MEIDLDRIISEALGAKADPLNIKFNDVAGDTELTRKSAGAYGAPYYATDPNLGVEYYMPVTLTYPDPAQLNAADAALIGSSTTGVLKSWNLPFPLISIRSKKTIIETPLTERRGTVKELISIDDYEISIRGWLISADNEYPESDVAKLRELYEVGEPISIKNPLTDIFLLRPDRKGSSQVVMTEFNFPGLKGVKNVEPYEIRLVSDEPFNLVDIS